MTDPVPSHHNPLAVLVGRLFHPFVVSVITLIIILQTTPFAEAAFWVVGISVILILPVTLYMTIRQRHGRYAYQRKERGPIYFIGWCSVIVCLILTHFLNAPDVLVMCLLTLVLWVPLQRFINQRFTKVSTHTGVLTGCLVGLGLLGHLMSPLGWIVGIGAMVLTAWARIETRNHTPQQVMLGILVGALPVLIVFPLMLR